MKRQINTNINIELANKCLFYKKKVYMHIYLQLLSAYIQSKNPSHRLYLIIYKMIPKGNHYFPYL